MGETAYSTKIAREIRRFLIKDGWRYSFDRKNGIFNFRYKTGHKLQKIRYMIIVHMDEFTVYGISPIWADFNNPKMLTRMAEFICRANFGLQNGSFELDFNDGEIRYKSYVDCDNCMPSIDVVKNSIYLISEMYKCYGPGILDMVFTDKSPEKAVAECEEAIDEKDDEENDEWSDLENNDGSDEWNDLENDDGSDEWSDVKSDNGSDEWNDLENGDGNDVEIDEAHYDEIESLLDELAELIKDKPDENSDHEDSDGADSDGTGSKVRIPGTVRMNLFDDSEGENL